MISLVKDVEEVYIMFNSSNFCGCRGFIEDVRQCSMALHTLYLVVSEAEKASAMEIISD